MSSSSSYSIRPTFRFYILLEWLDGAKIDGFAEIPGKNGKIWYSYVTITPSGRTGNIIETKTTFYEVVGGVERIKEIPDDVFKDKHRYLGPLKNIERIKERSGDFIFADDPHLENEKLSGRIIGESDEWIELVISSGIRGGTIRFLKE